MAEEAEKNNQIYILDSDKLKKQIDDLFFKWFDKDYKILARKDESFSADESLDTLTNIVKRIRAMASDEANKANKKIHFFIMKQLLIVENLLISSLRIYTLNYKVSCFTS